MADIGAEEARELARRELSKPEYHRDEPGLFQRVLEWLLERLTELDFAVSGRLPGGWLTIVVAVIIVVAIGVAIWLYLRNPGRHRTSRALLDESRPRTAAEHRADSERLAREERWAEAIRERLRAMARDLEERAIVDPRPGRTADELAQEASVTLPDQRDGLFHGVRLFDDVWYGERPGTPDGYLLLVGLDDRLRAARPAPLSPTGGPA
ncbi:MAG: DUF4129 domain-containing protein [Streptosporangiales bacterium]|nr:DUF4129 domain-containing protein [Streptosporangiales bacterium]